MTVAAEDIQLGELRITVRELKMGEYRQWQKEMLAGGDSAERAEADTANYLQHPDEPSYQDTLRMCSLTESEMDSLSQSEYRQLRGACKRLNEDVFLDCRRRKTMDEQLGEMREVLSSTQLKIAELTNLLDLKKASPALPEAATRTS